MVEFKCSGGQVNRQVTRWRGRFGWCFLSLPGFTRKITGCTWCAKPPDIRERAERAQSWRTRSCSEIYTCIAYCMYIPVCLKIGERFSGTILRRDHQLLLGKSRSHPMEWPIAGAYDVIFHTRWCLGPLGIYHWDNGLGIGLCPIHFFTSE